MGKLIYVDGIIKRLERVIQFGCRDSEGKHLISAESVLSVIESSPAVDAVPVKHGHWIYHPDWQTDGECGYECSECGRGVEVDYAYCPHCGAKMDGKDGEQP